MDKKYKYRVHDLLWNPAIIFQSLKVSEECSTWQGLRQRWQKTIENAYIHGEIMELGKLISCTKSC